MNATLPTTNLLPVTTVEVQYIPPTVFEVAAEVVDPDYDMVVAEMHEHTMRQLSGFVG